MPGAAGASRRENSPSPGRRPYGVPVRVTRPEIAALLAVAQDHAFGQPPGAQLRATVLAQHLAGAVGVGPAERATTWWASSLRFLGCTGHAFDMAVVFGDEIEKGSDFAVLQFVFWRGRSRSRKVSQRSFAIDGDIADVGNILRNLPSLIFGVEEIAAARED